MFGFVKKLFAKNRTIARRTPRRASLQVECLEDRTVPTTLSLFRASMSSAALTLAISNIAPGHTIQLQCQSNGMGGMEVFDNGNLVNNEIFNKATVNAVNIQGSSNNLVVVDDSNGMPFGPGTTINLSGGISELKLQGGRAVAGSETYVAGGAASTPGTISLDNLTFRLNGTPTVVDEISITGTLDVQESGNAVLGQYAALGIVPGAAGLSDMGSGGGGTLYFSLKPSVVLEDFEANTDTLLGYAPAATLETSFTVEMHGSGETTYVAATSAGVGTAVEALGSGQTVDLAGNQGAVSVFVTGSGATVNLYANEALVHIVGVSTTDVFIGQDGSTNGIDANVQVSGAAFLSVNDKDNDPTSVTVKNGIISGIGLFGNNNVTVSYFDVTFTYVVYNSPTSPITI